MSRWHIQQADKFLLNFITKNPEFKDEAQDYYALMMDEVEAGESPDNEFNSFQLACEDLLE